MRLRKSGWKDIVVWECEVEKSIRKVEKKISRFLKQ
jgi:G:T-mismatch repair DNA endonuclease (very short patch repair protein)